ncbi:sugar ABC transporter substrate-binding protein (plasmid) [Deinococcus metallilatus]|uniref:Multiple sugar transport system substrate-binding protein n=1 Tax=Deinococcus metallilatus TaxID=1211322 RepID=A0AAJ5K6T2_9DEIO|nr:sugar ABC transporter substrate-binding protein [Deinococcus metallilatus]MBB5293455.1 multiple sugar transport system substrate-binding protein [Deinococcus metallilatus]QBY06541.1 sugar ABC transporter substrate-binding protein [Deinococcus metallilatus]RXJ17884.1 sugar ABC transporter substrate-binding protein [Deinococcus metallilatus]TLK32156.1 sugar ABC transporter substrate-binding protein [Deinococcus metallilatus]GMA15325.1 sugar ABC transporter substrate-binding protein [Deinococc
MQKSKKVLFALAASLLLASSAQAATLQFWKFGTPEETANKALQGWVDQWNKENPDTQVALKLFPFNDYTGPVLTTAFASGSGPDVFWASPGTFLQYVSSGVAADLSSIFTPALRADLLPAAVQAVTVNGKPYAMPFEQEPVALFYNKDILAKYKIPVPRSWNDVLKASATLKAAGVTPIVIEPAPGAYQNFTWYPFLWQTGANVANPSLTQATMNSGGAAQALDFWRALIQRGYAPRTASDCTCNIGSTPFASGKAAMIVDGMWAIQMLKEAGKVNFGVTHLPTPTGKNPVTVYGGWTQVVNAKGQNVEAAKKFTAWMWAQGTQRPLEWVSKVNSKFSPRKSVTAAGKSYYDQPYLRDFRDLILPTARAEPRFPAEMVKIVGDAIQSSMFRNTPGQVAANQAQAQLVPYLKTLPK